MRSIYLLAVVATRLISVVSMLILSHVMTANAFGQFALINTNALAIQMVAGSWLVSITQRAMVSEDRSIDRAMMAAITAATLVLVSVVSISGLTFAVIHPDAGLLAIFTVALAIVFIIYELTLALENAVGNEVAYASFAMSRNVIALIAGVGLVLIGLGAFGPVVGLLIATAFPLAVLPGARRIWTSVTPSLAALRHIRPHLGHGMAGGVALGTYILVNAPSRNIFAQEFGTSMSGVWTLCADLFNGPLVVLGNAYALSQVRLIYISASTGNLRDLRLRSREMMEVSLTLALPYAIGATLFASDVVKFLFSDGQVELAASVVVPAAVQSAALLVLYGLTSVALAWRRYWLVGSMVLSVAASATIGASVGLDFVGSAHASMAATVGSVAAWLCWTWGTGLICFRWREFVKLAIASSVLWLAAMGTSHALVGVGLGGQIWILVAGASGAAFAIAAIWLRLSGFMRLLPDGMHQRMLNETRANDDN